MIFVYYTLKIKYIRDRLLTSLNTNYITLHRMFLFCITQECPFVAIISYTSHIKKGALS